ncbi:MAG: TIGR02206 family membrane protein, partial [Planctomycetota bacterium]
MNLGEFSSFSLMHAVVVFVITAASVALIRHAHRRPERRHVIRRMLAVAFVAVQIAYHAYWLGVRGEVRTSLPLHLCDIAGLVAAAAFIFPTRLLRTLLYFWGFSLSSLAFVIPVLDRGPATMEFWMFWLSHWVIVGGAVYLVAVEGFRPTGRSLALAIAITIGYGLLMV